ncbi:MAG TPA: IPT/TIG domain-containing protein [Gemmatimonadaceae bacterium]|nr:IPT/TIG domain-containing protein [Gemmatimonadaceae bacterium]
MSVFGTWPTAMRRIALVVSVLSAACSDQSSFSPPQLTEPSFAKAAASPTVKSASPAWAEQGAVNLSVTINGSGFDKSARASWNLNGVPYAKIAVNSTSFVSSSQIVANISIAADAEVNDYDVVVMMSGSKQGIGSDLFTVTLAQPIPLVGRAINMAGQVVGEPINSSTTAALWDPSIGLVPLPNAYKVWGIDETGTTISGKGNDNFAAVWTSTTGPAGPWTETPLPLPPGASVGSARSLASDASGNALFIAGSYRTATMATAPIVWTRTASGWQARWYGFPPGVLSGWVQSVNAKGQSAGMDGSGGAYALYWDSLGTPALLSSNNATAWSINGDGTVVVGSANGVAAMWVRTLSGGVYGPWSGDILLDTPANSCSSPSSAAFAVNAAGTAAVGTSCNQPVAWLISGTTATRRLLGTLGPPNSGSAFAINNLDMPNAAGGAGQSTSGFGSGVFWRSF